MTNMEKSHFLGVCLLSYLAEWLSNQPPWLQDIAICPVPGFSLSESWTPGRWCSRSITCSLVVVVFCEVLRFQKGKWRDVPAKRSGHTVSSDPVFSVVAVSKWDSDFLFWHFFRCSRFYSCQFFWRLAWSDNSWCRSCPVSASFRW